MIIVTGTKRSGTSAWMHVLVAAGLPSIGDRFPPAWDEALRDANPDGFFESELVAGINFQTNPHPRTGAYLSPEATRGHAVKVFVPGLVRSDVAFIDRCIATVRGWRDYVRSSRRVQALAGAQDVEPALPPALDWWTCNFGLVRDLAIRGYPAHVLSYDALLRDPAGTVAEVLQWVGAGDPEAGAAVVGRRAAPSEPSAAGSDEELAEGIPARYLSVFDALYDVVDAGRPLTAGFVDELNRTDAALRPAVVEHQARISAATVASLLPS